MTRMAQHLPQQPESPRLCGAPALACEAADQHVELFVREQPEFRTAQGWRQPDGGLGSIFG